MKILLPFAPALSSNYVMLTKQGWRVRSPNSGPSASGVRWESRTATTKTEIDNGRRESHSGSQLALIEVINGINILYDVREGPTQKMPICRDVSERNDGGVQGASSFTP